MKLILLIDALGWEILRGREFLEDVLPYRRAVRSVYGFSAGAIPSILTGRYPQEHMHWGLFYYAPERSPFGWMRGWEPFRDGTLPGRIWRKMVEVISRRRARYTGYFETYLVPMRLLPFFDICESRNIYLPGGVPEAETIFDWLRGRGVRWSVHAYHEGDDGRVLADVHGDIESGGADVVFAYLSQFDAFLHKRRDDEDAITARLSEYEAALREVVEHARGRHPGTEVLVCSDHGMTRVRGVVDVMERVGALGLRVPGEVLPMYDSTMARFWFRTAEARERVLGVLEGMRCGRVLSDEELRGYGVLFPDRRYGEVVFALEGGWVIVPSYMGRHAPRGMHGYLPEEPGMTATLLTSFPVECEVGDITALRGVMERMIESG